MTLRPGVIAAAGLLAISGCSFQDPGSEASTPPPITSAAAPLTLEQCRTAHVDHLNAVVTEGVYPRATDLLTELGCTEYMDLLTAQATVTEAHTTNQLSAESAEEAAAAAERAATLRDESPNGYVDPLAGTDEGSPPNNSERSFSCTSPEEGVTVCEGDVPASVGDYLTPREYLGSR